MEKQDLSSSLEDYLETILELQEKHSVARVKDIADQLSVKRSSVTIALRALSEKEMVNYSPYSVITLTAKGYEAANSVRDRHNLLTAFFTELYGIDPELAEQAACMMEHGMMKDVYLKTKALYEILQSDTVLREDIQSRIAVKIEEYNSVAPSTETHLMDLNCCVPGDEAIIHKIIGTSLAKKRYMEMGLTVGQEIRLVKAAPLDDPIEIQVRNYRLSLRRKEAENILVERKEQV